MDKPELTLIVGPVGCGKTYTLLKDVLEQELPKFDFVVKRAIESGGILARLTKSKYHLIG